MFTPETTERIGGLVLTPGTALRPDGRWPGPEPSTWLRSARSGRVRDVQLGKPDPQATRRDLPLTAFTSRALNQSAKFVPVNGPIPSVLAIPMFGMYGAQVGPVVPWLTPAQRFEGSQTPGIVFFVPAAGPADVHHLSVADLYRRGHG